MHFVTYMIHYFVARVVFDTLRKTGGVNLVVGVAALGVMWLLWRRRVRL